MKEINVGHIKSIADLRPSEKSARKEHTSGAGDFQKTLDTVTAKLDAARNQGSVAAKDVTPSSIKEQVTTLNRQFDEMMAAKQNLSQLYLSMKSQKTDDKA